MKRIYLPSSGPEDWKRLLADPDKQWRPGYSARTAAYSWEAAKGLPPEIKMVFRTSGLVPFRRIEPLFIVPEYRVSLPGRGHLPQNDVFVLARDAAGDLLTIAVEIKAKEPFGPTLQAWDATASPGKTARLTAIRALLGLPEALPGTIRYQLLHRTASAVIEARRFNASSAVMLVHAFGDNPANHADYGAFLALYGQAMQLGQLIRLATLENVTLYTAWITGDPVFLSA
jgi:hypothetical protein